MIRSPKFVMPTLAALVFSFLFLSSAHAVAIEAKDSWQGLYFNNQKIGYSHIRMEKADFRGKPAVKIVSNSAISIEMLGTRTSQDTCTTSWTDAGYHPIYQEFKLSSNGSALNVSADYQSNRIVCKVNAGGGVSERIIEIPEGANLSGGDIDNPAQGRKVYPGQKSTCYYLNPLTIALDKSDSEVQAVENVRLANSAYQAFRIVTTSQMGRIVSWQTADGDTLKGEMPMGMAMYREDREHAINRKTTAPAFVVEGLPGNNQVKPKDKSGDFALATAIIPNRLIQNPRTAKSLSVTINGAVEQGFFISDSRQTAKEDTDHPGSWSIKVRAAAFDSERSVHLPIRDSAFKEYLISAPYLESEAPEISEIARQLKGSETNAASAAERIRQWVYKSMKPDASIGVPRSCLDVYKKRIGVCRDYATLFAGIARAAGIPTRMAGGIIYADGRFYYHAWAECWLGEWVPFDATLKESFVDATHIKFSQGGVTDMYNVSGIIGRIQLKIQTVE